MNELMKLVSSFPQYYSEFIREAFRKSPKNKIWIITALLFQSNYVLNLKLSWWIVKNLVRQVSRWKKSLKNWRLLIIERHKPVQKGKKLNIFSFLYRSCLTVKLFRKTLDIKVRNKFANGNKMKNTQSIP